MAKHLSSERRRLVVIAGVGLAVAILMVALLIRALADAGSCWACG